MTNTLRPRVRVVLPTHNRAALVSLAIESVLAQTYRNWELFVSNDGSTDNSEIVLAEIAKKDSRIKILNNSNGGAAQARNRAIEAPGLYEFIAFLDDDDQWLPHHLEDSCKFLEENPTVNIVFSMVKTHDLTGSWTDEQFQARASRMQKPVQLATLSPKDGWYILDNPGWWQAMVQDSFVPHTSTMVIRAMAVSRQPWFDVRFEILEDLEFLAYLAINGSSIGFMNSNHVHVHYQGDNLTGGLLNLDSPILSRRYDSVVRYKKLLLQYATNGKDRKIIQRNIARTLYFRGQCYSEQFQVLAARRCYWESLMYKFCWMTWKSFLLSVLPKPVWYCLKKLRA